MLDVSHDKVFTIFALSAGPQRTHRIINIGNTGNPPPLEKTLIIQGGGAWLPVFSNIDFCKLGTSRK